MRRFAFVLLSVLLVSCGGGGSSSQPPTLMSITVTPATPGVPNGQTQQFTATGNLSDSTSKDLTNSVFWASSATSTATIDTSGLAHTLAVGSTTITATSGVVSGSTTLNVAAAVLKSLAITPSTPATSVGRPTQLAAYGTYSDSTQVNLTNTATWTSSAPSVATIDAAKGIVTGVTFGNTTITATVGSITTNATLTIGARTWHLGTASPVAVSGATATLLPNGKVLVAGGAGGQLDNIADARAELYQPGDFGTDSWSSAGSMSMPRVGHTATLLPSGLVLVTGGVASGGQATASGELYDPATNKWSASGQLATGRASHTATLLPNGKVLVVGGDAVVAGGPPVVTAELYDPAANAWSAAASPADARLFHSATLLLNGKVLVAGGFVPSSHGVGGTSLASAELYDPASNTWSPAAPLAAPRDSHTATLLADGRVLIAGGPTGSAAEVYNPATNTWSTAGSLVDRREYHTATLLPDGTALVTGGVLFDQQGVSELYDPIANAWSAAADMRIPRQQHTATRLPNGDVLVTSGVVGTTGALVSQPELYW